MGGEGRGCRERWRSGRGGDVGRGRGVGREGEGTEGEGDVGPKCTCIHVFELRIMPLLSPDIRTFIRDLLMTMVYTHNEVSCCYNGI